MELGRCDDSGCEKSDRLSRANAITATGPVRTTSVGVETDEGAWFPSWRSETAQQESAWACVMEVEPVSSRCMGQLPLSQHAIRAAGLDCHPAHSITPLATNERMQRSAAVNFSTRRTLPRMGERD